jgi:tetratricopeptide (TPR) repeat protein
VCSLCGALIVAFVLQSGNGAGSVSAPKDHVPKTNNKAQAVYVAASQQFTNRQFEEAKASFQRVIQLDPTFADAYRGLGLADLELHDYQGAYQAWLKAVELNPKDEKSKYCLGRLFYDADLPNESAAWLRQALELNPADYQAMTYLGLCAEALDFNDTASQLYRKAIAESEAQQKPYSWAYLSLANFLKKQGKQTEALPVLEQGAAKCPEAHLLAALGEALALEDQREKAEAVLRRAIALDPTLSQPHYRLALVLRSAGRADESKQEMLRFQEAKAREDAAPKVTALRQSLAHP